MECGLRRSPVGQTIELLVIWDDMVLMWRHSNGVVRICHMSYWVPGMRVSGVLIDLLHSGQRLLLSKKYKNASTVHSDALHGDTCFGIVLTCDVTDFRWWAISMTLMTSALGASSFNTHNAYHAASVVDIWLLVTYKQCHHCLQRNRPNRVIWQVHRTTDDAITQRQYACLLVSIKASACPALYKLNTDESPYTGTHIIEDQSWDLCRILLSPQNLCPLKFGNG